MTIEPSTFSQLVTEGKAGNESEFRKEQQSSSEGIHSDVKEKPLFVPVKKDKTKKKEDILSSAVDVLKKVADNDQTKEFLTFFRE